MNLKRYHLCLVLAVAFLQPSFLDHCTRAETVEWIRQFGTELSDQASSVSADELGNVFVSGSTSGSLGGVNAGSTDAFVSKFDSSGALAWTRQLGTAGGDNSRGVSSDGLGNVYITGVTEGDMDGPNAGAFDAFISKYDGNGSLAWTRQFGTNRDDYSEGVAADGLGNVYISGWTGGNFFGEPVEGAHDDSFISKYDAEGTLLWMRQTNQAGIDRSYDTTVDDLGNVYISGISINNNSFDAFISKYDADGTLVWTGQFGGGNLERAEGVAVDMQGNVIITGLTAVSFGSGQYYDGFVTKFDASGNQIWSRHIGTDVVYDTSYDVGTDGQGNVYVTGRTAGEIGGPNFGGFDGYVNAYDPEGTLLWTRQLGTSLGDSSSDISSDGMGNVYLAGFTGGGFDGPNAGSDDAFLAKIRLNDVIVPGDTNGDGLVDLADLNNVRNYFGGTGLGDTNADGVVDLEDLNAVRNNFGTGVSGRPVPEPSAVLLLSLGAIALGICYAAPLAARKRLEQTN
jgi:hypothetical protein